MPSSQFELFNQLKEAMAYTDSGMLEMSGYVDSVSGDLYNLSGHVDNISGEVILISGLLEQVSGKVEVVSGQVENYYTDLSGSIFLTQQLIGTTNTYISGLVNTISGDFVPFSGGTMTGSLIAVNSPAVTSSQIRNIYAGTTAMTDNVTALATGVIYLQY